MNRLHQIQEAVRLRAQQILSAEANWPCRKGCDDCCRRLASVPRVSEPEWQLIATALDSLPADAAERVRRSIQDSRFAARPVVCPILDRDSGTCLVYEARPVACRAYGFYAEGQYVLGCNRIESIGEDAPDVVWGNQVTLEDRLHLLGPAAELWEWLDASPSSPG